MKNGGIWGMNIQLQDLTKQFPARGKKARGAVTAVRDLTFEVPDGKLVGLLGPRAAASPPR